MKHVAGYTLIALGALLIAGLVAFIYVAVGYRHSFTSSDMPIGDFLEGIAFLSPVALIAVAMIFFGNRLRR